VARWLWLSVLVVVADQVTKAWVSGALRPYELVPVIDGFFNLTLAFNTGAAFSFLAQGGGWQRWLLSGLAVVVAIVLVVWLTRLDRSERWTAAALSLVIGGAVGNLLDRLRFGHVVDFLDFYLGSWHWPAFNVADSAITVGVAILLLASFRRPAEG
jgi:signal peptidase II